MIHPYSHLIAAIGLLVAVGCTSTAKLNGPMPEAETRVYRECKTDAQCVYALNGCCDCANGGDDFAVAKNQLEAFRAKFQCDQGCTEIGGDCGRGKVACEQGLCVYREPTKP